MAGRMRIGDHHARIVALLADGASAYRVAKEIGSSQYGIRRYMARNGLRGATDRRRRNALLPHINTIRDLLSQGVSQIAISRQLDCDQGTLSRFITKHGLKPNDPKKAPRPPRPDYAPTVVVPRTEHVPVPPGGDYSAATAIARSRERQSTRTAAFVAFRPTIARPAFSDRPQTDNGRVKKGMCPRCGVRPTVGNRRCIICERIVNCLERRV